MEKQMEATSAHFITILERVEQNFEHVNNCVDDIQQFQTALNIYNAAFNNYTLASADLKTLESRCNSYVALIACLPSNNSSILHQQLQQITANIASVEQEVSNAHHHLQQVLPSNISSQPVLPISTSSHSLSSTMNTDTTALTPGVPSLSHQPTLPTDIPSTPMHHHALLQQPDLVDFDSQMANAENESEPSGNAAPSPRLHKSARHSKHLDATRSKVLHIPVPSSPLLKPSPIVNFQMQTPKNHARAKGRKVTGTRYDSSCMRGINLCILTIFVILHLISAVQCSPHLLSSLSLNTNGLGDFAQHCHIQDAIQTLHPCLISISETKSQHPVGHRLRLSNYNIYENPGIPTRNKKTSKWGVVLATRKDLHAEPLDLISRLHGHTCTVDLHLPGSNSSSV
ncbi:hypothetical protein E1B28_005947 [Marasmius oreades]|uniref:Uncharacterized protein n=1 Tax=Marasmius oreades TaxID=181124 RepID=A0A9P7S4R2_9AGAR|nr:uncharacterized protein E1B28_005947 [Marasmius oreades]KAG7095168.1 hypothetical protein E1B28_005947 [Marasmius oreades]